MALERGNKKEPDTDRLEPDEEGERKPALPDFARRALSIGLSGFFLTEETIRKALGDTLPKDWMDFATEQSERTRKEFLERLSFEIAQSMQQMDLAAIMREILEGRTLEVKAEIRLKGPEGDTVNKFQATLKENEGKK
jgi:hypothetical protein